MAAHNRKGSCIDPTSNSTCLSSLGQRSAGNGGKQHYRNGKRSNKFNETDSVRPHNTSRFKMSLMMVGVAECDADHNVQCIQIRSEHTVGGVKIGCSPAGVANLRRDMYRPISKVHATARHKTRTPRISQFQWIRRAFQCGVCGPSDMAERDTPIAK